MRSIGESIRSYRAKHSITLPDLATKARISKGLLSKIETQKAVNPSLETLEKIAKALNMGLSELLALRYAAMWTTLGAVAFARAIHETAFAHGWNVHLGGGLLTKKDTSDKDADFLLMPRYQVKKHDKLGLLATLKDLGWGEVGTERLPHRDIHTVQKGEQVAELIFVEI